jgi:uncharacterized membrane protein
MAQDSSLSIAASVIGILTFAVALLLGVYARTIQVNQIINSLNSIGDEIRELSDRTKKSIVEIEKLRKGILGSIKIKDENADELYATFKHLYILILKNAIFLYGLIGQSIPTLVSRWEDRRDEVRKTSAEIESLKSKIYDIQLLLISKQVLNFLCTVVPHQLRD